MSDKGERKGLIIFGVILVIVLACALAAYQATGNKSIEDRFLDAAGILGGNDTASTGEAGFSLEGNPVSYLTVLVCLAGACIVAYRYFRL